jgi:hypothetical protein
LATDSECRGLELRRGAIIECLDLVQLPHKISGGDCTAVEAVPARELTVETSPAAAHTCAVSLLQITPMALVHHASRRMAQFIWDDGLRKLRASILTLWRGPEISEVESYVCGVDSPDEVESCLQQLWHIPWHPTCRTPCKASIKSNPSSFRVPLLASWVAAEEISGESCLGVEVCSDSVPQSMAGHGNFKGRGREGNGNNQDQWQQSG